jgi:hypothetical protein
MDELKTYFEKRMSLYGITDAENKSFYNIPYLKDDTWTNERRDYTVFTPHVDGIEIIPTDINRRLIKYARTGEKWQNKIYSLIRLQNPETDKKGKEIKYRIPKGQGTPPLFPPAIIEAYEQKTIIKTLYITEGYFKAFKACMHGMYCIGLVSITCMIDKSTNKLHGDILEIIKACNVQRVVWLTDADFRQISKDISIDTDIYKRPNGFYQSVIKITELLSDIENIKVYFAHINEDLECKSKGLDDLLIAHPESIPDIVKESGSFDKIVSQKYVGNYFTKFYISAGLNTVRNYFMLNDVTQFYLHHVELRKELKEKPFRFNGTIYLYDQEQGKCIVQVPREASSYCRVGDGYYEFVYVPDKYGNIGRKFVPRQKATIKDDLGKDIFEHIPKYKAFCNVPSHENYQAIIHNCFNLYSPFEYEPEDGECDLTIDYLKHLFGENEITLSDGRKVKNYELGLDYITILYKNPQHILPILCFVSEKRGTGKTTFVKWLKILFTENCAIIGNQDFENGFNAHWTSKFLVCVDETKIDKDVVVEKIKSLSTSGHTMMNAKGKDQVELEIFMKFVLLSNNVKNFINIDGHETRFWVMEVPPIQPGKEVFELEKKMQEEIPAFLNFINKRQLVTKKEYRHWFNPEYLVTDTLRAIQEHSKPTLWKVLKERITDVFENFEINSFEIPLNDIKDTLLRGHNRTDGNYLKEILKQNGYKIQPSKRGRYPKTLEESDGNGGFIKKNTFVSFHTSCYIFERKDFTDSFLPTQQTMFAENPQPPAVKEKEVEELPF